MYSDADKRLELNFTFISSLGDRQKKVFFDKVIYKRFEKGKILVDNDSSCSGVALVLSGTIRIYKISEQGREVTLYRIGRAETCVLAVSCILGQVRYPAIAEAEDDVEAIIIPADYFTVLFNENENVRKYFFQALSERLAQVMFKLECIAFDSIGKRLAGYIRGKCGQMDKNGFYRITHEKIASDLGTAREVVSRGLKEFERNGIIQLKRGKIKILDCQTLKNLSEM